MIENIFYAVLAILGLGFLVFIHELGHYFMAKKQGMRVEAFAIGFGKPILNRTLKYDSDMKVALKLGFLSFDSTRVSANDVDFPLDVILYKKDSFKLIEHRFEKTDLDTISEIWGKELQAALSHVPETWMDVALNKLPS